MIIFFNYKRTGWDLNNSNTCLLPDFFSSVCQRDLLNQDELSEKYTKSVAYGQISLTAILIRSGYNN